MLSILKASAVVGVATVATLLAGIARAKVSALWLGPEGVGLVSQAQNVSVFVTALGALSGGGALIASVQRARARGDEAVARVVDAAWFLALGTLLLLVFGVLALRGPIGRWAFAAAPGASVAMLAAACGGTLAALSHLPVALLYAYGEVRAYALATVASTAVSVTLLVPLVIGFGVKGAFLHIALAPLLTFTAYLFPVRRLVPKAARPLARWPPRLERVYLIELLGFAAFAGFTAAAYTASQVAGRAVVMHQLSVKTAGLLQVMVALGAYMRQLAIGGVTAEFHPAVARSEATPGELASALSGVQRYCVVVTVPMFCAVSVVADVVVRALYSTAFVAAAATIPLYLASEIIRMMAFPGILLLQARKRLWLGAVAFIIGEVAFIAALYSLVQLELVGCALSWGIGGTVSLLASTLAVRRAGMPIGLALPLLTGMVPLALGATFHLLHSPLARAPIAAVATFACWQYGLRTEERNALIARARRLLGLGAADAGGP